jgi:lipopolysaccharide export system ATP-binding protein
MILRAENLVKRYKDEKCSKRHFGGSKPRRNRWSFGTNGAGKTTSFYMIVGLVKQIQETSILMI